MIIMGYKSDIRIITSVEGYEMLKQFIYSYINKNSNDNFMKNLLEECDLKFKSVKECYFGWNDYKRWEECLDKNVKTIMEGLKFLEENNYSYRFYRLGEDKEDYEEYYFTSQKDGEQELEFPNIRREFDDKYTINILNRQNYIEKVENKEEIDI